MGIQTLSNQKIWLGGYDITGSANALALNNDIEAQGATTLGNDTLVNVAGVSAVAASIEGYVDTAIDPGFLFSNVGNNDDVLSFADAAAEGSVAYFFKALQASYNIGGQVGELHGFSVEANGAGRLIRGNILANQEDVTASGNSSAQQLGAASASQKIWVALHVLEASAADTLDVVIESDASNSFAGSETSRITFDQMNAVGSQFKILDGAVTDTWWRSDFTIAGTDPSFSFIVLMGIL
jgi:hypothetical protein